MFQIAKFGENGKFRMKCVEKYDFGTRRKFLDMLLDQRKLLWK